MQVDPGYQRAHLEAARRLPTTVIVIIVMALAALFAYDYVERAVNPPTTTSSTATTPG